MPDPAKNENGNLDRATVRDFGREWRRFDWPLGRAAHPAERRGCTVENWPLATCRSRSFYTMRIDALDRFGTRLKHRMSRVEIAAAMARAGLGDIRFSESVPFWCAVGLRL